MYLCTMLHFQVHSRLEYLKYLVSTLSKTRGIEDALLVFSHDINIESIDNLVRNITFARVRFTFFHFNDHIAWKNLRSRI